MDTRARLAASCRTFVACCLFFTLLPLQELAAEESPGDSLIPGFYDDAMLATSGIRLDDYEQSSIDYFAGRLSRLATDVSIPGNGGLALNIVRSYQSQQPYRMPEQTTAGVGWNVHFGWVEITDYNKMCNAIWSTSVLDNPVLHLPDGSTDILAMTGEPLLDPTAVHYRGKAGYGLICSPMFSINPLSDIELVDAEGKRYRMERWSMGSGLRPFDRTAKWYVKEIRDRHGNWLWIDYEIRGSDNFEHVVPVRVTASDGRDVLLEYSGPLLSRITNAGEVLAEYFYEPSGSGFGYSDLVRVVLRSTLTWTYRYSSKESAAAGSMTEARNPFGGVTTYAWQSVWFPVGDGENAEKGTAIATVVQYPGETPSSTWRYTFMPATSFGERDRTVVSAPEGVYTYTHHSAMSMRSGEVWMVGLKTSTVFEPGDGGPTRTELFEWHGICYGTENYKRTNASGVWAAVDPSYTGAYLAYHEIRIAGDVWRTFRGDPDWSTDYVGQPQMQTEISDGPGSDFRTLNRRYVHIPGKYIYFLLHQEWITQADHPGLSPMQVDFDDNGNPVSKFDRGFYTFLEWDAQGNLASSTRGLSGDRQQGTAQETRYADYHRGVAGKTTFPDGSIARKVIDDDGRVRAATDRDGHTTRYEYDNVGRVTRIDYPLGNDMTLAYPGTRTRLQRGDYEKVSETDGFGHVLRETHRDLAGGRVMEVVREYDDRGQVVFTSYPNAPTRGTRYAYDGQGRVVRVTHAGGERSYRYLPGAWTEVTDENGAVTRLRRRETGSPGNGELARIESPEGIVTTIERNEYGMPVTIAQGDGLSMTARSNTYNASLVLLASMDPESGEKTYGYDWAGNLTVIRRQDGVTGRVDHQYNYYDANDRLVMSWAPSNALELSGDDYQEMDAWLEFSWTPEGKPVDQSRHELVNRSRDNRQLYQWLRESRWHHEYDANGNTVSETAFIDGMEFGFLYGHDGNDKLSTLTYPDGFLLDYAPDAFGWPTRAGSVATNVRYHETGQLAGFTYGNGRSMDIAVDDRFLVAGIAVAGVVDLGYTYDPAGNVSYIADRISPAGNVALRYDDMNRLVGADGEWGSGEFAYDLLGNITRKRVGTDDLAFAYDGSNRLAAVSGSRSRQFAYDGFGNIARRDDTRFGFDGMGNLLTVIDGDGELVASYQYDARGRRIATMRGGITTYSLQANSDQLLYEWENAEGGRKRNVYLGNIQVASTSSYVACWEDVDGDGIPECAEVDAGLDPRDPWDAEGDQDGDGLDNLDEYRRGTGISDADSDEDGIADGVEVSLGLDPRLDDAAGDLDGDGLPNLVELVRGLDPSDPADGAADSDGDGLTNAQEYLLGTQWNDADSDNDDMPDGYEVTHGLNPLRDDANDDLDGDGLSNGYEFDRGLNPSQPGDDDGRDSDDDGLSDMQEGVRGTNPLNPDTDGDGLPDGVEVSLGLDPLANDAGGDLDGDGLPNLWEWQKGLAPNDADDASCDPDGDGATTLAEYLQGSNPFVADVLQPMADAVSAPGVDSTLIAWRRDPAATGYNVRWGLVGDTSSSQSPAVGNVFGAATSADALYWFQVEATRDAQSVSGRRKTTLGGARSDLALPYTLPSGCERTQLEVVGEGAFFFACERAGSVTIHRFGRGALPASQSFPTGARQDGVSGWRLAATLDGDALYAWLDDANVLTAARYDAVRARWQEVVALEDHAFEKIRTGYTCGDGDADSSTCRFNEVYAFELFVDADGVVHLYYLVNTGYASGAVPRFTLWRARVVDGIVTGRMAFGSDDGLPVRVAVASLDQVLVVENSAGQRSLDVVQTIPNVSVYVALALGRYDGTMLAVDRKAALWAATRSSGYDLSASWLCGVSCTPPLSSMETTPRDAVWAFGGVGDGQAYWYQPGAIRVAKVVKSSKGVYSWTRPANLVADTLLQDAAQVQLARGDRDASFTWSDTQGAIRRIDIRPDGSWTAPVAVAASGRVVAVASDRAGNTVLAIERDGNYQFLERRRLSSLLDLSSDSPAPVVGLTSTRSGKTTISHVVTLAADQPANVYFRVTGGSVTAGGVNTTAEQRYRGPFTVSFAKGASATVTWRGINLAETWGSSTSRVLQ